MNENPEGSTNQSEDLYECSQCGADVSANDQFCRKCGNEVTEIDDDDESEFECNKCGADISADDNVCPNCGGDVSEIDDNYEAEPANTVREPKPQVGIAKGIIVAFIGVGLIVISPMWGGGGAGIAGMGVAILITGGVLIALGVSKSTSSQPRPPRSAPCETMKICPDCAESVKDAAKICRFCGHKFP